MSYYESAEGETISQKRALKELARHGISDASEFFAECGESAEYDAQAVLLWLGY